MLKKPVQLWIGYLGSLKHRNVYHPGNNANLRDYVGQDAKDLSRNHLKSNAKFWQSHKIKMHKRKDIKETSDSQVKTLENQSELKADSFQCCYQPPQRTVSD